MTSQSKGRSQDADLGVAISGAARGLFARLRVALDRRVATLFFWCSVSRRIEQLSALSDAELRQLGFERNEIVARVYEEARGAQDQQR
ncbi:hypothetical protein [Pelagibius marinus]|uniref:hypothetical protein n=1 Tax=Pelagibius marinus TaxID=2762760 RepID=UPI001872A4BD|nr:hypothetical protein [Pelagibius marinus]